MNLGLDHSNTYPLIETALDNKKMSKVVSVVDGAVLSQKGPFLREHFAQGRRVAMVGMVSTIL
jgi:hypothetical protein